jgi:hypothetical protein
VTGVIYLTTGAPDPDQLHVAGTIVSQPALGGS